MINNFLGGGKTECTPLGQDTIDFYMFPKQGPASEWLVIIVLICVPLMLCVKPCIVLCCPGHKNQPHANEEFDAIQGEDPEADMIKEEKSMDEGADEEKVVLDILNEGASAEHHEFSEVFIHQMIETIEFVLGTVSNTASYLRLWALSLAHSQLAEVFLDQALIIGWGPSASVTSITIMTFILWFAFMTATFAVLLIMDVLEVFLHTLRLHWVEFQNKFYGGTGYLYIPFSFTALYEQEMKRTW